VCGKLGFLFGQAEDGIRGLVVTGVQTCALPIYSPVPWWRGGGHGGSFGCGDSGVTSSSRQTRSGIEASTFSSPAPSSAAKSPSEIGRASCRERDWIAAARALANEKNPANHAGAA